MTTAIKAKTVADLIADLNPCDDALVWASKYPATATAKAWVECERGDYLLWLIGKIDGGEPESDERKKLVRCACECARLALPYTKDSRVLRCIENTEHWTNGEATIEEARNARAYAAAAYAASAAAAAIYDDNGVDLVAIAAQVMGAAS